MRLAASRNSATDWLPFLGQRRQPLSSKHIGEVVQLSIIIVSYNAREALEVCLGSIRNYPPRGAFETIVVDNASADGSPEMVKSRFPEARLMVLASNRGYANGCNQGARLSKGRTLLFLNCDVEVTPGALEALQTRLQKSGGMAVCSGRLESYGGSPQPSCRRFPTHASILLARGSALSKLPFLRRYQRRYIMDKPGVEGQVDWVAGACMLITREVFESLGGFDEQFFMYAEDLDLCYRLKKRGGVVLYVSDSVFKHRWGASLVGDRLPLEIEHHRSIHRYFRKHCPRKRLSNLLLATMLLAQLGSLSLVRLLSPRAVRRRDPS